MTSLHQGSSAVRTQGEPVELSIPVQSDLILLARLTAATVASRAGFDVEEIEDLRLAVDELCFLVTCDRAAGRLNLMFITDDDAVEVICALDGSVVDDGDADERRARELSVRILAALVDEHGEEPDGGRRRGWLRKRKARHEIS
jgi:serine/threonine-protein kinase RsbW